MEPLVQGCVLPVCLHWAARCDSLRAVPVKGALTRRAGWAGQSVLSSFQGEPPPSKGRGRRSGQEECVRDNKGPHSSFPLAVLTTARTRLLCPGHGTCFHGGKASSAGWAGFPCRDWEAVPSILPPLLLPVSVGQAPFVGRRYLQAGPPGRRAPRQPLLAVSRGEPLAEAICGYGCVCVAPNSAQVTYPCPTPGPPPPTLGGLYTE